MSINSRPADLPLGESTVVVVSASQASCIKAMQTGLNTRTKIAIGAKLDLNQTDNALHNLKRKGLVKKHDRLGWRLSQRGSNGRMEVVPDPKGKRGPAPLKSPTTGSSAERILKFLNTPQHARDLAKHLGLSRQRVHQIIVKLLAQNLIRLADDDGRVRVIAKYDDPTILLSADEERVLSVTPEGYFTSKAKIRLASQLTSKRMNKALEMLLANRFVKAVVTPRDEGGYTLSSTGAQHPQRDVTKIQADRLALKVKSNRVYSVLSFLEENGDARIVTVRNALGISQKPMNALMQYLKRLGLVRKANDELNSLYLLTEEGISTQSEMKAMRYR